MGITINFKTIQLLLHGGEINAQELVGGSHHVCTIGFRASTFLIHGLVYRLISRKILDGCAHYEQRLTVFALGLHSQGVIGQPTDTLIVALAQGGRNFWLPGDSKQTYYNRSKKTLHYSDVQSSIIKRCC